MRYGVPNCWCVCAVYNFFLERLSPHKVGPPLLVAAMIGELGIIRFLVGGGVPTRASRWVPSRSRHFFFLLSQREQYACSGSLGIGSSELFLFSLDRHGGQLLRPQSCDPVFGIFQLLDRDHCCPVYAVRICMQHTLYIAHPLTHPPSHACPALSYPSSPEQRYSELCPNLISQSRNTQSFLSGSVWCITPFVFLVSGIASCIPASLYAARLEERVELKQLPREHNDCSVDEIILALLFPARANLFPPLLPPNLINLAVDRHTRYSAG